MLRKLLYPMDELEATEFLLDKVQGRPRTTPISSTRCAAGLACAAAARLVGSGAVPQPTHVKIDVDGIEHRIVAGAQAVLRDRRLRSLLIEVNHNLEPHRAMVRALAADGWQYDPAQVAAAERKQGTFQGVAEYVFRR